MRPYEAGDDVRRIDWNVTARTGQTHVRVELAERVLVTWLVFDASASMAFGTAERRKADVAEGVALAIGHTATRRGNRLGLVAFGADDPRWRRPRQGRRGLLLTLAALREEPAGSGGLAEALALLDGLALQRSLVVDRLRLPRPDRLAPGAPARRRPASDARRRDPRPARAGARRCRRAAARRSRDRPPAARRHERPQPARALRRRPPPRSARGLVRMLSAAGVRHVALSTEGDWLRAAGRLPEEEQRPVIAFVVSFKSPVLLLFLLLVPAGDRRSTSGSTRRRERRAAKWASPALAAEHGRRRARRRGATSRRSSSRSR